MVSHTMTLKQALERVIPLLVDDYNCSSDSLGWDEHGEHLHSMLEAIGFLKGYLAGIKE